MKPNFALNLSHDGIGLWHRSPAGWISVGSVMLDDADFPGAMGRLRRLALGLAPQGITSKLVIPGSQMLYLELEAPGPDAARRRNQIATALEGRTPYAVSDLVFDWSGTGKNVQVAVVARETLTEAEAFAEQHGFSPVSFVALPEPGTFAGEPFFGLTSTAAQHLPEGSRLDRDQDPIRLVASPVSSSDVPPPSLATPADTPDVKAPEDTQLAHGAGENAAPVAPEPPTSPPTPATTNVAFAQEPGASLRAAKPARPAPTALPADPDHPEVPAPSPNTPHPQTPKEDPLPQDPSPEDPPPEAPQPHDPPYQAPPAQDPPVADKGPIPPQGAAAMTGAGPDTGESGPAKLPRQERTSEDADPDPSVTGATIIALPEPRDGTPEHAAPVAPFVSRRKPISADADSVPNGAPRLGAVPARNPHPPAATAPKPPKPDARPMATSVLAPDLAIPDVLETVATADSPAPRKSHPAKTRTHPSAKAGASFRAAAKSTAAIGGAAGKAIARDLIARINTSTVRNASLAAHEADPAPDAASARTVFGGPKRLVRNKPRYLGLILTAALVLFMGIVALWSSLLGSHEPPQTVAALATDDLSTAPAPQSAPVEAAPVSAPQTVADTAPPPADVKTAATPETAPETAPETTDSSSPTAPPPSATDGHSGVWGAIEPQDAQQPGDALAGRGISPTDPAPVTRTGSELPPIGTRTDDPSPTALPAPVPYDQLARIAPDGLLQPTAQGVIAPGGFTLYAGRPPRTPRERPQGVLEAAIAASRAPVAVAPAPNTDQAGATDPEPYFDPALAGHRPVSRPASIKPSVTPADPAAAPADPLPLDEGAIMSPADQARRAALQAVSPRARPAAIQAAAATLLAAQKAKAAAAAALEQSLASASPQAVSVSRRPANRPRNFSGAVEAALALAVASEPAAAVAAPARIATPPKAAPAAPQHDEIDEPEPVAPTPKVPTSASVAKQATQKNALDMGSINLIGLYGSSGNRRALVRLSNGKFVKVEVGDKLDGGRVTGIGDGQLTYQKHGKNLLLKLLKDG